MTFCWHMWVSGQIQPHSTPCPGPAAMPNLPHPPLPPSRAPRGRAPQREPRGHVALRAPALAPAEPVRLFLCGRWLEGGPGHMGDQPWRLPETARESTRATQREARRHVSASRALRFAPANSALRFAPANRAACQGAGPRDRRAPKRTPAMVRPRTGTRGRPRKSAEGMRRVAAKKIGQRKEGRPGRAGAGCRTQPPIKVQRAQGCARNAAGAKQLRLLGWEHTRL